MSIAKGVPYRFDVYWRTMFPKSRFCRVLEGVISGARWRAGFVALSEHQLRLHRAWQTEPETHLIVGKVAFNVTKA